MKVTKENLIFSFYYKKESQYRDLHYNDEPGKLRFIMDNMNEPKFCFPIVFLKFLEKLDTRFVGELKVHMPLTFNIKTFSNGASGLRHLTKNPVSDIAGQEDVKVSFNKILIKDRIYYGFPGFIIDENFKVLMCNTIELEQYSLLHSTEEELFPATKAEIEFQKSCYDGLYLAGESFCSEHLVTKLAIKDYCLYIDPSVVEDSGILLNNQIVQKILPALANLKIPTMSYEEFKNTKRFYDVNIKLAPAPVRVEYGKVISNTETLEEDINKFLKVEKEKVLYEVTL